MEDNISEQGLKTRLLWLERAATLYDQYDYAYRHGMCRGESECGMCYFMRKVALEEPEVIKLIDTENRRRWRRSGMGRTDVENTPATDTEFQ